VGSEGRHRQEGRQAEAAVPRPRRQ